MGLLAFLQCANVGGVRWNGVQLFSEGLTERYFLGRFSGMEIELLAILNGAGKRAIERVFFSRGVRANFQEESLDWEAFLSEETCLSVDRERLAFCRPNCSSSSCAP